jgi:hypothetical protein
MILFRTIWSVAEPVLTPGFLIARFKEWVPCASLANLGNDIMCAAAVARIAGQARSLKPEHRQRRRAKLLQSEKPKKTKTAFNMKKEKKN